MTVDAVEGSRAGEPKGSAGRCLVIAHGHALCDPPACQAAEALAVAGWETTLLQGAAWERTMESRTRRAGRSGAPARSGAADMAVNAARVRGATGALVELMAAGVRVVSNDIPPNRELVQEGRTGGLAVVDFSSSFWESILRVSGQPPAAWEWADAARSLVFREYDEEVRRRLLLQWVREVTER